MPAGGGVGDERVGLKDGEICRLPKATENQMLVRGAEEWGVGSMVGGGGDAVLTVAAADTPDTLKDRADYTCDGTIDTGGDQTEINAALAAADIVYLCPGTFYVSASISIGSNQSLVSDGVVIKLMNNAPINVEMITNSDWVGGNTNILLRGLLLDGNKANNAGGAQYGGYFENVGTLSTTGCIIENCTFRDFKRTGFEGFGVYSSIISGCMFIDNDYSGLDILNGLYDDIIGNLSRGNSKCGMYLIIDYSSITGNICSNNNYNGIQHSGEFSTITGNMCDNNDIGIRVGYDDNTIVGNTAKNNATDGIYVSADRNVIANNTSTGNTEIGIAIMFANYSTISGNMVSANLREGIGISTANHNSISDNFVYDNGKEAAATYDGIIIEANSDYNNIQNNTVRYGADNTHRYGIRIDAATCGNNLVRNNDLYNAGGTANLSDAGTNTITLIAGASTNRGV